MAFSEFNPQMSESLWLQATVAGRLGRAPFELYPGICITIEEKHGKPQ
jgi:hypothetical protein